jgi:hypothetical protein
MDGSEPAAAGRNSASSAYTVKTYRCGVVPCAAQGPNQPRSAKSFSSWSIPPSVSSAATPLGNPVQREEMLTTIQWYFPEDRKRHDLRQSPPSFLSGWHALPSQFRRQIRAGAPAAAAKVAPSDRLIRSDVTRVDGEAIFVRCFEGMAMHTQANVTYERQTFMRQVIRGRKSQPDDS